jgi:chromosome segregation ATPase
MGIVLISCQQKADDGKTDTPEDKENDNRIAQLELESAMKDSVINESLAFFNEIKANLEAIGIRRDEIRELSENPELEAEDKQWILEEIRHINFLREDNARLVKMLNSELDKSKLKINELEIMVESLMKDIQWKDEQIASLQKELDRLDHQYSVLFDAYQEQAVVVDRLRDEMNTVFYAYGTSDELSENKIISKKNGFIGIGRRLELRKDFNTDYFTKIDATKKTSINIRGKDVRLLTDHAPSSYTLTEGATGTILTINDTAEFWKISKYLVVLVDA